MNELANIITDTLADNGFINHDDYGACQYGINVFLISAAEIGFVLFMSLFLKNIIETLLWLIAFIPIRIYAGGYHADTRLKCFAAFIVTYAVFSIMVKKIIVCPILYLLMILCTVFAILKWAPLQHKNKHVSETEMFFFRKKAIIFVSIESLIAIAILLSGIRNTYSIAVLYGLFTSGISLIVGKIKNNYTRSENYEQS